MWSLLVAIFGQGATIHVSNTQELVAAASRAKPGTTIKLKPGNYAGGAYLSDLHGEKGRAIRIEGESAERPPKFSGGNTGLQLSNVSYVEIRNISIEKVRANGLNIDDGGPIGTPSHHIVLEQITVRDLPEGNHDGIKLSGVDSFRVERCSVARWGGSAIDMVGCHQGLIRNCDFREGGDNGVQTKGGSRDISIQRCLFVNAGQRGVNIGGSTGAQFFRPSLARMRNPKYEAKYITVEGSQFTGCTAPIAFVGIDGASVRFNTFIEPGKWVIRILQETREPEFVACQNGSFNNNLVVFRSSSWSSGGMNVGPGTNPDSFLFERNFWYCVDQPSQSKPLLAPIETEGTYGEDPKLTAGAGGWLKAPAGSPAVKVGAHAWQGR